MIRVPIDFSRLGAGARSRMVESSAVHAITSDCTLLAQGLPFVVDATR